MNGLRELLKSGAPTTGSESFPRRDSGKAMDSSFAGVGFDFPKLFSNFVLNYFLLSNAFFIALSTATCAPVSNRVPCAASRQSNLSSNNLLNSSS